MKRSARRPLCALVLAVTGSAACGPDPDIQPGNAQSAFLEDSAGAVAACDPPPSAATRVGFVRWASGLSYMQVDSNHARFHQSSASAADTARLEITSPARSQADLARGCVIGRIVSNYADPAFGLIAGTTYVWADSSSPNSVHLVPDDGTSQMISYNMALDTDPDASEPVAPAGTPSKHVCQECTKSDWCVYPRDSFRMVEEVPPGVLP